MVHRFALTQARMHLGRLARRAHLNKEYFILEKDGIPLAGIMDAEEFEDYLETRDPGVRAQIHKSHQEYTAGKARPAGSLLGPPRRKRRAQRRRRR